MVWDYLFNERVAMKELKEGVIISSRRPNENDYHESYKVGEVWCLRHGTGPFFFELFYVLIDIKDGKAIWAVAH